MSDLSNQETPLLGVSKGDIRLDSTQAIGDISAEMARQTRRELLLFERQLDARVYDQQPFLDAIRRLALRRPDLSVRILIFDPRESAGCAHRLVDLARHLTSRIAIRCVDEQDRDRLDAFLIADERGYVHRRLADTLDTIANFHDPLAARRLRNAFDQIWERSSTDTELRRLFI